MKYALLSLVLTLAMYGQATDKPVELTKQNIKVLNGLPSSQLIPVMAFMSNSLGVSCSHCHTGKQWESDEKPAKEVARQHIVMTRTINEQSFKGALVVTCATCHRGSPQPVATPSVADAGWNKAAPPAPISLPSAQQLLKRYQDAIGGAPAFAVRNRVAKGNVTRANGREAAVSQPFTLVQSPTAQEMDTELAYPPEANRLVTRFHLIAPQLGKAYTSLTTTGKEKVRGREAWVVDATPPAGRHERLYFDTESGFLVRIAKELATPMGILPEEYDFDDWRPSGAAKLPFTMQWSRADYRVTHRFDEIRTDVER